VIRKGRAQHQDYVTRSPLAAVGWRLAADPSFLVVHLCFHVGQGASVVDQYLECDGFREICGDILSFWRTRLDFPSCYNTETKSITNDQGGFREGKHTPFWIGLGRSRMSCFFVVACVKLQENHNLPRDRKTFCLSASSCGPALLSCWKATGGDIGLRHQCNEI